MRSLRTRAALDMRLSTAGIELDQAHASALAEPDFAAAAAAAADFAPAPRRPLLQR